MWKIMTLRRFVVQAILFCCFDGLSALTCNIKVDTCYELSTSEKLLEGTPGDIFCDFDGETILDGNLIRTKGGLETEVLTFTAGGSTPKEDYVDRVVIVINSTGINIHYNFFTETDDANDLNFTLTNTGFQQFLDSIGTLEIISAPSPVPDVTTTGFSQSEANIIKEAVSLVATSSPFTIDSNDHPAPVITATKDGMDVTCDEPTGCTVAIDCVPSTTVSFVSTVYCDFNSTTTVEFTCNEITTPAPTPGPGPDCDCCEFGKSLYLGPGVIWPFSQMTTLVIVCLVITGVWTCCICGCCKCSHKARKFQCQIQTGISILCCTVAASVTIACGVCYGINEGQDESCNCDGSPVYTVILPPLVTIAYIIGIVSVSVLVPSKIKGDDGPGCGNSSNARAENVMNADAERGFSKKKHARPEGVPLKDPLTPRKLPPIKT